MKQGILERIHARLSRLYGASDGAVAFARLRSLLAMSAAEVPTDVGLTERDIMLITYADQVRAQGELPLQTLHRFLRTYVQPTINSVHLLPFYPYTSDDGFSVVDYYAVDQNIGTWDDVRTMSQDFSLMFDAVFNHVSKSSTWFQAFQRGEAPFTQFFHVVDDPTLDLSMVRRPRTLPLLHEFQTNTGAKRVWTTFSEDQVDLNAATPEVLLALISVLLFYVQQGARYIRLDAIAYLWKEIGTSCIHLWQTHEVVKLMRDVLDVVAPHIILITETNVPHEENISYLGSGADEAQLVYQFALPPLLVHTFRTGNAEAINGWAQTLARVGTRTSYFNFTASHDGIGVTPVRGLLPAQEAAALEDLTAAHGGLVSFKNNSDGSKSAYELNITYFDAITHPSVTATKPETAVRRFLCSQAIMLALMGVPGVYFHSLFGSRNDEMGVKRTNHARSINREKVAASDLQMALQDPASLRSQVFSNYMHLLRVRAQEPAFHPQGEQRVLALHPGVVALERTSTDGQSVVAALHNVTASAITVRLNTTPRRDLLNTTTTFDSPTVPLAPYQVMWLKMA